MGNILAGLSRFADADRLYARSWDLSQNDPSLLGSRAGNYLTWTGDVSGALDILAATPESLRDHGLTHVYRAGMLARQGEIMPAITAYERVRVVLAGDGNSGPRNLGILATYRIGQLEARLGHGARAAELYAEALAAALQYSKDFPDLKNGAENLVVVHALRKERTEALAAIDEAMRIAVRTHDAIQVVGVRWTKAEMLAILGDTDAAIGELRAIQEAGYASGYDLRLDLEWEPLRGDAKFQQLMKEAEARADAQPRPKK
ncbi:MAG: hypothetical protein HY043_12175 [Verrucomicrobia bacterium]|nr:hypothetical protein [Verrucomicrobiota bacterium]